MKGAVFTFALALTLTGCTSTAAAVDLTAESTGTAGVSSNILTTTTSGEAGIWE